LQFQAR